MPAPRDIIDLIPGQRRLSASDENTAKDAIRRLLRLQFNPAHFSVENFTVSLAQKKRPDTPMHPWKVTRADEGETKRIRVHPGSIDGVVPTNIFANLTITGTGVEYVVLTTNMLTTGVASCSLSIATDPPTPSGTAEDAAPDTLTDVIAVLMDGVVFQIRSTNLATQTELAVSIPTPTAEPWRENLIKFYKWVVTE